jgi:ABC-type sugar transport system permease subunit
MWQTIPQVQYEAAKIDGAGYGDEKFVKKFMSSTP